MFIKSKTQFVKMLAHLNKLDPDFIYAVYMDPDGVSNVRMLRLTPAQSKDEHYDAFHTGERFVQVEDSNDPEHPMRLIFGVTPEESGVVDATYALFSESRAQDAAMNITAFLCAGTPVGAKLH